MDHSATVDGRQMAENLQTNDATLGFLAALDFDPAIEKAVISDDDENDAPSPPAQTQTGSTPNAHLGGSYENGRSALLDRPHRCRARRCPIRRDDGDGGNVEDMTASFLADLLEED